MEPSESSASPVWAIYPASGNPSTKEQMWRTLIWKIPSVFPHGIRLHKIGPSLLFSVVLKIIRRLHIKSIITCSQQVFQGVLITSDANKMKVRCPQRACPPLHVLGLSPQSRKPTMWSMRGHMHSLYDCEDPGRWMSLWLDGLFSLEWYFIIIICAHEHYYTTSHQSRMPSLVHKLVEELSRLRQTLPADHQRH